MIDHRRTIDDIQSILYAGGAFPREALATISQDYVGACEDANERLRQCQELLRKGLRAEAIQRCEVEPNLLDVVAALDFPERAQWCELLKASNLLVPPELLIEVAADLNTAYAQEQPLIPLMRQHRLLALGRAPLRQRITTLRQIADADSNNLVWQEDLRSYERARHQQIQSEQLIASNQRDEAALKSLATELRDPKWREAPPPHLLQSTNRSLAHTRTLRAREELATLEPLLTAAHACFDAEEARRQRERWTNVARIAELSPDDPLAEMVAPALEWLQQMDIREQSDRQFQSALAEFEYSLDQERPRDELERLYYRLEQLQRDLPEALVIRYQARVHGLELAAARRAKLWLVAIVGAILLVAGVTGAAIVRHLHGQEVASNANALRNLLDDGKLNEAVQFVETLRERDAEIASDPFLQELIGRVNGQVQQETERRRAFEKALNRAQTAGVEAPDWAAMAEAKRLTKTEDERSSVVDFEGKIGAKQRELQQKRDEDFADHMGPLLKQVEQLEQGSDLGYETRLMAIQGLLTQVANLRRRTRVSEHLQNNLNVLAEKVNSLQRSETARQKREGLLVQITSAVGQPGRFRDRLAAYSSEFPESQRAEEFTQVVNQESMLWKTVEDWDRLIEKWNSEDATKLSPRDATARLAEANELLERSESFPDAQLLKNRLPYLGTIAARQDANGRRTAIDSLNVPLNHFLVANLQMVLGEDGKRYYCTSKPEVTDAGTYVRFRYLVDPDPSTPDKPRRLHDKDVKAFGESPQSVVSKKAKSKLQALADETWESTFWSILNDVHGSEHMDPIVKVQLLDAVLDAGCQGSRCLQKAFEQQRDLLRDTDIQSVNWVDPNNKDAESIRSKAATILSPEQLKMEGALAVLKEQFSQLKQSPFEQRYQWIGWLVRDESGQWQCDSQAGLGELSARLSIVHDANARPPGAVPTSGQNQKPSVVFEAIGELRRGKASLNSDASGSFIEGRPVFAVIPRESKRSNR